MTICLNSLVLPLQIQKMVCNINKRNFICTQEEYLMINNDQVLNTFPQGSYRVSICGDFHEDLIAPQ